MMQPAVSVGNVGQLAADLLINSCGMTRVGLLDTDLVVPAVGNDAYDSDAPGTLHTQLERARATVNHTLDGRPNLSRRQCTARASCLSHSSARRSPQYGLCTRLLIAH